MKPRPAPSWPKLLTFGLPLWARLLLGAAVPILSVGVYLGTTLLGQKHFAAMTHQILDQRIEMMQSAAQIKQALVAYDDALFRYLAIQDSEQLSESQRSKNIVIAETQHLQKLSTSPTLNRRLEVLLAESQLYFKDAERLIQYSQNSPTRVEDIGRRSRQWVRGPKEQHMELAFLSEEGRARLIRVFSLCDEIITVNRMALEQSRADIQTLLSVTKAKAIVLGSLSIGLLLIVMSGFTVSVLMPMGELMRGVRKIEQGDLDVQIPVITSDEVGELTCAFNQATQTIREQRDQLWRESITDHLTGAYNQRHFRKVLSQEIERAKRGNTSLALLMMDIDHFKVCNDTHGHEFGNEVIRQVARQVRNILRQTDLLARYGGDEFAVLLPDTGIEQAQFLGQRLLEAVASLRFDKAEQGEPVKISLSVGGACFPFDSTVPEEFVRKADEALYAAKKGGRARMHWSHSDDPVFRL